MGWAKVNSEIVVFPKHANAHALAPAHAPASYRRGENGQSCHSTRWLCYSPCARVRLLIVAREEGEHCVGVCKEGLCGI